LNGVNNLLCELFGFLIHSNYYKQKVCQVAKGTF
jgi:hypothetical protein